MLRPVHPLQPPICEADTAISRVQRLLAALTAGLVAAVGMAVTPWANVKIAVIPGFLSAFAASMVVINIILATLLFSKGAIEGRGDATRLGTAYLLEAFMLVSLLMTFPGAIVPGSLIGTGVSAIWVWIFWHAGFGLYVVRYAWHAGRPDRRPASFAGSLIGVTIAAIATTIVATSFLPYLPTTFDDGQTLFSGVSSWLPGVIIVIDLVAAVLICRLRFRTPEQLWLGVAMVASLFDVWLTYLGTERYSIGWYLSKSGTMVTSLTVLLSLLHEITLLHIRAAGANAILQGLARQDGLTGLYNRRHLDELLVIAWRRGERDRCPLSVLMIDVDFFKSYNDHYGHLDGDACLRQIAAMLHSVARRPGDVAARYGGEEFVILLPATDAAGAAEMARNVQTEMRALHLEHKASRLGLVTLSIGLATFRPSAVAKPQELLAEADLGLYKAKMEGRDRICGASDRLGKTTTCLVSAS